VVSFAAANVLPQVNVACLVLRPKVRSQVVQMISIEAITEGTLLLLLLLLLLLDLLLFYLLVLPLPSPPH